MRTQRTSQSGQLLPQATLFDTGLVPACTPSNSVDQVWSVYEGYHLGARLDEKRRRLIRARLNDGYTPSQLCDAIRGCHGDAWYQGENDRGKAYCDIALILRDADHVDRFIDMHHHPRTPSSVTGRDVTRLAGSQRGYLAALARVTR